MSNLKICRLYFGAGSTSGADSSIGAGSTTGIDSKLESAPVMALLVCGSGSGIGSKKFGIITALVVMDYFPILSDSTEEVFCTYSLCTSRMTRSIGKANREQLSPTPFPFMLKDRGN